VAVSLACTLDPIRRFPKDRRLPGTRFTQWTVEALQADLDDFA